jgi:F-type H+-transporting ATPase subunit delta
VRESIRGYADAVVEESANAQEPGLVGRILHPGAASAGDLAALADDVSAVSDVLAGSDELRSVLSDPGVPSHARRAVFADLFGERISPNALRLVLFCVEAGRASELAEDIAWLAERTAAARAGLHASGPAILGHHAALERVDGYAASVLESVTDESGLSEVEDELFRFERIVAGSTELSDALTGRGLPAAARSALVVDLVGDKATPATTRLATYATTIGRPRDYLGLLEALIARVAAETHRRIAEVRAMVEMTDEQQQRLAAALSRIAGQSVEVRVVVDTSVLGGFVATIGDTVVDGSVRHRLDVLKERLVLSQAPPTNQGAETSKGAQS